MKNIITLAAALTIFVSCGAQKNETAPQTEQALTHEVAQNENAPVVYMTTEISAESLVRIYDQLGAKPTGKVAVKISTGESEKSNQLRPELIGALVKKVSGTIVECNTAYAGSRNTTEKHQKEIDKRGYREIAEVDLMDAVSEMKIPVRDSTYMKFNIVGANLANYDFMINLAHFKGHQMAGFGGVLKNQSIGVASSNGKAYIHSNGLTEKAATLWQNIHPENQDKFVECMATAAAAVSDYMKGNIVYIAVMNNISIDCDCNGNPAKPELKDMGILASTDPVALDQACIDLVYRHKNTEGDNASPLIARINDRHGIHILEHAAKIGLGSREYKMQMID